MPDSVRGGLCPVDNHDFVEDMRDVGSDSPEADAELLADLAVRLTSSDKPEYGYLAFRQMLGVCRNRLWTGLELLLKCHDPCLKGAHTEYMGSMQRLAQQ